MAIFALCHPTGVHVTQPKVLRLTNGFWEYTSSLAGRVFRGVRHYSILFYSTKLVPQPFFAARTSMLCGLIINDNTTNDIIIISLVVLSYYYYLSYILSGPTYLK